CGSIGQSGKSLEILAEIVRVRVYREQIHVDGKRKFVSDEEAFFARRNVELPVVFQLEQHREERCGFVGEIQAKTWLDLFRFAGRLQMNVQYQVSVFVQAQRHTLRLGFGHSARFPEEEVAVRIKGF